MLGITLLATGLLSVALDGDATPAPVVKRGPISVSVSDAEGQPVSAADVQLHVGLVCDRLLPGEELWRGLERINRQTRGEGVAEFKEVPLGAGLTAFAQASGGFGVAHGAGDLQITLQPTGTVSGSVNIKDKARRRLHNLQLRHESGWTMLTERMDAKGKFSFYDVPPGEVVVELRRGNWICETRSATVKSGKTAKLKAFRPKEGRYVEGVDPCLDVPRVELVDEEGDPQPGLLFWWSSPTGFGVGMSDSEGVVDMQSHGVFVGRPPFVLHLGLIGRPEQDLAEEGVEDLEAGRWLGEIKTVRRVGAVIEVTQRLRLVSGRLIQAGEAAALYRVRAISAGESARDWSGFVSPGPDSRNPIQRRKDEERGVRPRGEYSIWVPPGDHSVRVVTVDGVVHDLPFSVPDGRGEYRLDLELP